MHCAAFNTGPDFHLLDHIAPLSSLLQIPLFLTEEKNFSLAKTYYPEASPRFFPELEKSLADLVQSFDVLFECKFWLPHLKNLIRDLYRKEVRLVFCSHGQSDKGYKAPLLAPYDTQDLCLIYGPLLQKMLREQGVSAPCAMTGNYRLLYYQKHRAFYDTLVEKEVFSRLSPHKKTLLYAPTWLDADQSTSFFEHTTAILKHLPSEWNLLLKVHPLLEMREPGSYHRLISSVEKRPSTCLLTEFPPIYPLLARVDAYLGDYSSIGYDFLFFQRPMFFLLRSNLPQGRLHRCGEILDSPKSLEKALSLASEKMKSFAFKQSRLYAHAFGAQHTEELFRDAVLQAL